MTSTLEELKRLKHCGCDVVLNGAAVHIMHRVDCEFRHAVELAERYRAMADRLAAALTKYRAKYVYNIDGLRNMTLDEDTDLTLAEYAELRKEKR